MTESALEALYERCAMQIDIFTFTVKFILCASGEETSPRSLRQSSPRALHCRSDSTSVSIRKLSPALSKQLKPSNIDITEKDSSGLPALTEFCRAESTQSESTGDDDSQSSLSLLADMALADLEASQTQDSTPLVQNAVKRLAPAKSKASIVLATYITRSVCQLSLFIPT